MFPTIACVLLTTLAAGEPPAATGIVVPAAPGAAPVSSPGRVEVTVVRLDEGGKSPAAGAVVWLLGSPAPGPSDAADVVASGGDGGETSAGAVMTSRDKRFTPRVVAVAAGDAVEFPNADRIYHNVFSLSRTRAFDLGLYRNGASKEVRFDQPGVVRVYCNIHPKMVGYVLVVDGRSFAVTGDDGGAALEDVRPGDWQLGVWDERGGERRQPLAVTAGGTTKVRIGYQTAAWKLTPHRNKYGEEYVDPDDEESRY